VQVSGKGAQGKCSKWCEEFTNIAIHRGRFGSRLRTVRVVWLVKWVNQAYDISSAFIHSLNALVAGLAPAVHYERAFAADS
jgi:hypothetical protein